MTPSTTDSVLTEALAQLTRAVDPGAILTLVDDIDATVEKLAGDSGVRQQLIELYSRVGDLLDGREVPNRIGIDRLREASCEVAQELCALADVCRQAALLLQSIDRACESVDLDDDTLSSAGGGAGVFVYIG